MNIKIANRLVELRKKSGLSQEQLADKLGLSRQAVSKWERAEASPDTDNLICLAKLYNVSLDDLLSSDESIDDIAKETKEREEENKEHDFTVKDDKGNVVHVSKGGAYVHVNNGNDDVLVSSDGVSISSSDKKEKKKTKEEIRHDIIAGSIWGGTFFLVTITYLLLGCLVPSGWALYWPLFILAPTVPSLFEAISKRRFCEFIFPLLVTGIYCFIGMFSGLWHPYWLLFLLIPVYYIVFSPIDKNIHKEF